MRVAFLGPAGTFTEEALRASAPAAVEEVPYATVHDAAMAVQRGEADRAVVPIENSIEGPVTATLDVLAGPASEVRIAAEVVHPIHHCLVAREPLEAGEVTRVVSHPQAIAQCARYLDDRLPDADRAAAVSTAEAVLIVAGSDEPWAAIASALAAELYGATVVERGIEDEAENVTRFVWLQRAGEPDREGASKTSVVFWGFNDSSPGALVAVLREFSDRGINLTKIESRPRRVRLGNYMFFADLEGAEGDPAVVEALDALRSRVETLRVLGSYPVA